MKVTITFVTATRYEARLADRGRKVDLNLKR